MFGGWRYFVLEWNSTGLGSKLNLAIKLKETWIHNTTNFTHIFSLCLFFSLLMIHSWFISLWWKDLQFIAQRTCICLICKGWERIFTCFEGSKSFCSWPCCWVYEIIMFAYLFDMNMLPIWEVHMTEELVEGLFFCNNLVNYKYITCSLLCFLYTCWMCLIQIRQKYIRSSTVGKHNFGSILCFVYQLSNCFCFFGGEGVF